MEDRFLKYALIISCFIHVVIFSSFPYVHSGKRFKALKDIEIIYHKFDSKMNERVSPSKVPKTAKKEIRKSDEVLLAKKTTEDSFMNEISKLFQDTSIFKKEPVKMNHQKLSKRKITLPPIKSEQIKNPVYLSYYQVVRHRIKERAYVNYSGQDIGRVYVTFIVEANGHLRDIKLINEKTSASRYLKNISLKSVREAAPFAPFAQDLNYPELTFNIIISFEMEK